MTKKEIFCFSGNISWINTEEKGKTALFALYDVLSRGVTVRILCRVDLATMKNLSLISSLAAKHPDLLEVRHCVQPLRGFIIDSELCRLKDEKDSSTYKKGEIKENLRVFYDLYDKEWVLWLEQVFWNFYRHAPLAQERIKELERIF